VSEYLSLQNSQESPIFTSLNASARPGRFLPALTRLPFHVFGTRPAVRAGRRRFRPAAAKGVILQVLVRDNDVGQALRVLKKKLQREGVFREMKRRRSYEKPSERRAREKSEAVRRQRKTLRKRLEREGY